MLIIILFHVYFVNVSSKPNISTDSLLTLFQVEELLLLLFYFFNRAFKQIVLKNDWNFSSYKINTM